MATKYEGKRLREVKAYRRKSRRGRMVPVSSYYQRYDKPRGQMNVLKKDTLTSHSKTAWLKDRYGRFVGRANYLGETSATEVAEGAYDTTSNKREAGRYGRVYGRTGGVSEKRRRRRK